MNDQEIQRVAELLRPGIQETIQKTVNGKIDGLKEDVRKHNERHEADMLLVREHMKVVEPYLQGATAMKALGNGLKWLGGIVAAWLVIKGFIIK